MCDLAAPVGKPLVFSVMGLTVRNDVFQDHLVTGGNTNASGQIAERICELFFHPIKRELTFCTSIGLMENILLVSIDRP